MYFIELNIFYVALVSFHLLILHRFVRSQDLHDQTTLEQLTKSHYQMNYSNKLKIIGMLID